MKGIDRVRVGVGGVGVGGLEGGDDVEQQGLRAWRGRRAERQSQVVHDLLCPQRVSCLVPLICVNNTIQKYSILYLLN